MKKHNRRVSVVGLGYVGLPVAVALGRLGLGPVIAFDINQKRISELKDGFDRTGEVEPENLEKADLLITDNANDLKKADFHIVTVPTPVDDAHRPDLTPVYAATRTVAAVLKKGDIVVYESTVYPGVTENECVPLIEELSGLKYNVDFFVGYSPERINPGDKVHRLETIVKVVSGSNGETLDAVDAVYSSIVRAGTHRAPSIQTAEAAKVIENTQRDINIALMNELALIFNRMEIDTRDVLNAANTKWNFLNFTPGLVGGHCIGVDPYYLTYRAEQLGYHPQVILAGRYINDGMGEFVAAQTVKHLLQSGKGGDAKVAVLGLTFKENCPDIRNTRAIDIIRELEEYGLSVEVADPYADPDEVKEEFGLVLTPLADMAKADAVILAVGHKAYTDSGWPLVHSVLKDGKGFVADVKGVLDRTNKPQDVRLWRL